MKKIATVGLALLLSVAVSPAFAQAPNPGAEAEWQQFLSRHPGLAEHPGWLHNPTYMHDHPNLAKWLQQHPRVLAESRNEGMWDHDGAWHDSHWWRSNNPNYVNQYHPEWAENHPDSRGREPNDGDWDDQHKWHDRNWWVAHHHDWVARHHAEWLAAHGNDRPGHAD